MKKQNFAVFDTETIGISPKLVYDLALIVCNRHGETITKKSWIIREIITNPKIMLGAFYAAKTFSHYIPAIADGRLSLYSFADARKEFNAMLAEHNVRTICAYNIGFDRNAMRETARHTGHVGRFLESKMNFADLWLASCLTIAKTRKYQIFCRDHNLISEAGNFRSNAETVYSYITNNPGFVESHTALEDCEIEATILGAINRRKRRFPRNEIVAMPWRLIQ